MNIVMLVKDRKRLTRQALGSLGKHTTGDWNLTIVDDGSRSDTWEVLNEYCNLFQSKCSLLTITPRGPHSAIVGQLKNLGVEMSQRRFGRGSDWLYLSDNDVYFMEGWVEKLTAAFANPGYRLIGGQNHPFHHPISMGPSGLRQYGAVAGTSWLMTWDTWDTYGPLDGNAPGVGQSEDTAFCSRITAAGWKVGAMDPPVVLDTGITQTDGTQSIGHDIKKKVRGVYYA